MSDRGAEQDGCQHLRTRQPKIGYHVCRDCGKHVPIPDTTVTACARTTREENELLMAEAMYPYMESGQQ